mmetsp:Transcript_2628/g.3821  ORF Transcript_2628/g.3821 Transcript_2628/m.3821 type:complete len:325 (+) Transcript_2628:135-1109(+)
MDLPESVQSSILSQYSDASSILFYFVAILSSSSTSTSYSKQQHYITSYSTLKDALVHRYKDLAEKHKHEEELKDVLDIIREEIRTSKLIFISKTKNNNEETPNVGNVYLSINDAAAAATTESLYQKVSDWCAILSYFDTMKKKQQHLSTTNTNEYILWCGPITSHHVTGKINCAYVTSNIWTITSLDYLYNTLELCNEYLTHPYTSYQEEESLDLISFPYGYLRVFSGKKNEKDVSLLKRIQYVIEPNNYNDLVDVLSNVIVPSQMEYEDVLKVGFGYDYKKADDDDDHKLLFYWDGEDEGDFEYSLSRFADNVKRILVRMKHC